MRMHVTVTGVFGKLPESDRPVLRIGSAERLTTRPLTSIQGDGEFAGAEPSGPNVGVTVFAIKGSRMAHAEKATVVICTRYDVTHKQDDFSKPRRLKTIGFSRSAYVFHSQLFRCSTLSSSSLGSQRRLSTTVYARANSSIWASYTSCGASPSNRTGPS